MFQCPEHILSPTETGRTYRCSCGLVDSTYFDRKSGWEFQFDEISQPCKMSAGSGHEVNDGNDLLHKRQREVLTHPQRRFKPARWTKTRVRPLPPDRETEGLLCGRLDGTSLLTAAFPATVLLLMWSGEGTRPVNSDDHAIWPSGEMPCMLTSPCSSRN